MRYAGIIKNDFCAAPGVCVTLFLQGCPIHCPGCHNENMWNFEGGEELNYDTIKEIEEALTANGIQRQLCIMGGEPLCEENQFSTLFVIKSIKQKLPNTKIYLWTGYNLDKIKDSGQVNVILEQVDCVIDGQYIEELRDITLAMRGSSNQRILLKGKDF